MGDKVKLSERELIALEYLDGVMEANAEMIGRAIIKRLGLEGGGHYERIGSGVVGWLRKRGLIVRVPDLNAWRIAPAGRAALAQED